jgi:hypothetical protein
VTRYQRAADLAARILRLDPYAQRIVLDEIERLKELALERKRLGRDPDTVIN